MNNYRAVHLVKPLHDGITHLFLLFLFHRPILDTAQSPACADMAPCCRSHQPPAATLPPPRPPSRYLEMATVAEGVIGFNIVSAHMRDFSAHTHTCMLERSRCGSWRCKRLFLSEGSQPEREAGRDGDVQRYPVQAGGHAAEIL